MPKKKYTPRQRLDKLNSYNQEYKKKHYKAYAFHISIDNCSDIIQKLDSVPNKTDYIASLIREDIIKNGI